MALKIAGTTVVDDSRNLTNISNITASGSTAAQAISITRDRQVATSSVQSFHINDNYTYATSSDNTSQNKLATTIKSYYYTGTASTFTGAVLGVLELSCYSTFPTFGDDQVRASTIRMYDNNIYLDVGMRSTSGYLSYNFNSNSFASETKLGMTWGADLGTSVSPWYSMYIEGSIFYSANSAYFISLNNTTTSIQVPGNVVAYYSDERLKTKTGKISNPLDKVKSLSAFYYTGNEIAGSLGYDTTKIEVGLSAQEVQAVLPEIVKDAAVGKGYLTLDYGKLTPLLIEAIKEQDKKIERLEALVESLLASK